MLYPTTTEVLLDWTTVQSLIIRAVHRYARLEKHYGILRILSDVFRVAAPHEFLSDSVSHLGIRASDDTLTIWLVPPKVMSPYVGPISRQYHGDDWGANHVINRPMIETAFQVDHARFISPSRNALHKLLSPVVQNPSAFLEPVAA